MWIFLTIMNMLIPLTMIVLGYYFGKRAPKKINYFVGYRTSMSMINEDTWVFAHKHFGRTWFIAGLILLPVSLIIMILLIDNNIETLGFIGTIVVIGQSVIMILCIIPTEMALRKAFDKNGKRR